MIDRAFSLLPQCKPSALEFTLVHVLKVGICILNFGFTSECANNLVSLCWKIERLEWTLHDILICNVHVHTEKFTKII